MNANSSHSRDLTIPSLPVNYTRLIARELHLQERELDELLRGTGLKWSEILNDDTLISTAQQAQIARNGIRMSGAPWIGLRIGHQLTPPTHGPIGFLANTSPDLKTALEGFRDFLPSRVSFTELRLEVEGDQLACYLNTDLGDELINRAVFEAFGLSLITLIEYVLGRDFIEGELHYPYPKPDYAERFADYSQCPVTYDAPRGKITIPLALTDTPNATADHVAYQYARQQCEELQQQLPLDSASTKTRVMSILLSRPPNQWSEKTVAASLFISTRTLARRLKQEDTGFWALKDQLLASMAANYLRDTQLSVEAIATLLDYHDSPNFRRAFKRWYGMPPADFRQRNGVERNH
ncbi:MAG: AraC family transcriptional regulator [Candidatus Pelagadaptatus aseana]|uniref:AraC family transcriptional regulator n=1 Tax=Candidatus Pelagadaptatus aseana TaxID=3120508 RepID=UPI0039B325C3